MWDNASMDFSVDLIGFSSLALQMELELYDCHSWADFTVMTISNVWSLFEIHSESTCQILSKMVPTWLAYYSLLQLYSDCYHRCFDATYAVGITAIPKVVVAKLLDRIFSHLWSFVRCSTIECFQSLSSLAFTSNWHGYQLGELDCKTHISSPVLAGIGSLRWSLHVEEQPKHFKL